MSKPSARHPIKGEYVRLWTGELALCLGRYINPSDGTWDGSYRVRHEDGTEGYWYPTRLVALGVTLH